MGKWVRTSATAAAVAAGFVAFGTGVSFADSTATTSGNGSIGGGNQLVGNLDVPVNVSGNAVSLIGGVSGARSDDTGAVIHDHAAEGPSTTGNGSILGGNQAVIDGEVPVNISGNAVAAVLGVAGAASDDTGAAVLEHGHRHHQSDDVSTSGNGSILGGNQAVIDGDIPVNISGNAVSAVLGVAGAASEDTGALVLEGGHHGHHHGHGAHRGAGLDLGQAAGSAKADGYHRTAQAAPEPGAGLLVDTLSGLGRPIHISSRSIDAGPILHQRAGQESEVVHQRAGHGGDEVSTSGNGSILGGNQLVVPLDIPVNISGNAVGAVGGVAGAASDDTGAVILDKGGDEVSTSGNGSILGGNQAVVDGDIPVNISGNAVSAVLGVAGAASEDTGAAVVEGSGGGVRHTSHEQAAPAAERTAPEQPGLPAPGEVVGQVTSELPLRSELPDPTQVLPLQAEVPAEIPGSEAVESQVPVDLPQPGELSGLPQAATGEAASLDAVGQATESLGL
ncbi:ligand-binding sensor protein [Streptomonospora nanhaiensis]|uniref:Ligand-binding sensor protein n=1 Tax=Streptomonospora nanhaiensis TaxID=1323731 RepID=A0A853BML5_9ACTN|nr:chaplin family protein [Streptomonospora nanhaiensis]NYI96463.1 ligand-binding sensor protein [Streptomonospora nanhaiensis]